MNFSIFSTLNTKFAPARAKALLLVPVLVLASIGSNCFWQPVFSQESIPGPYPPTPASWNGQVTPNQPYVPSTVAPNYIGSSYAAANSSYGTYRNPSTSLQTPTYTGQALTYRPGVAPYIGQAGRSTSGFNPSYLIMGGGIMGLSALSMGARGLGLGRGGAGYNGWSGNGGSSNTDSGYTKDMQEADKRRAAQEEKIMRELKVAHQYNLKRKGISAPTGPDEPGQSFGGPMGSSMGSSMGSAPFGNPPGMGRGLPISAPALAAPADPGGMALPASAAGKLEF